MVTDPLPVGFFEQNYYCGGYSMTDEEGNEWFVSVEPKLTQAENGAIPEEKK